jgi:hypothetical protein
MLRHGCHCQWVQRLHDQRTNASYESRRVSVDLPRHAARAKEAGVAASLPERLQSRCRRREDFPQRPTGGGAKEGYGWHESTLTEAGPVKSDLRRLSPSTVMAARSLTTRHHAGFSMFHSKFSTFSL